LHIDVRLGSKTVEECADLETENVILVGIEYSVNGLDPVTKKTVHHKHCAYNHDKLWEYLNDKGVTKKSADEDRGRCCVVYFKMSAASSRYVFIINAAVSG
jgi:hypothetical protein